MKLPPRTIERLSKYRRLLMEYIPVEEAHIFSRNLARLLNITPEQVRRDLMLIGLTGNHRKGYNIQALVELIGKTIDSCDPQNIAIIGIGNLGRAVTAFIHKSGSRLRIVASFDIDPLKINQEIAGVHCYPASAMQEMIKKLDISIAILTVPPDAAKSIAGILSGSGIRGILNFTSVHLDVPGHIYLKDYDIITSLEEIGFFIKIKDQKS
jgi:redox-sensing transcriptional repressor